MNKKLLAGTIAGLSAFALAVPAFAQVSSSAGTSSTSPTSFMRMHHTFTQADVQQMITHDDAFLKNIDAFITIQKSATTSHRAALAAAALLTDDTARQAAVKKAHEDMRAAIQAAIAANPDLKGIMPFGKGPMMKGPGGERGRGHMKGRGPLEQQ